ncbi:MAG: hypothetical protein QHC79_09310 [Pseudosphingobacterium sp.]|nr:hypothetical protein [Pseudosphingobacterium sp.]
MKRKPQVKTIPAPENRGDFAEWFCMVHRISKPSDYLRFQLNMLADLRKIGIEYSIYTILEDDMTEPKIKPDWFRNIPDWFILIVCVSTLIGLVAFLQYIASIF